MCATRYIANGRQQQIVNHTIYVLAGLSRVDTQNILAHELAHTFINERPALRQILDREKITEGMCDFISFLYLSRGENLDTNMRMRNIALNQDKTYGAGFRRVYAMFENGTITDAISWLNQH